MLLNHNPRSRRPVPLPSGVAPARGRPNTSGDISALTALVNAAATNTWIDTGIMPGEAFAKREMIPGAADAIYEQLGFDAAERTGNYYHGAYATLLDSNGWAYFKNAKQFYYWGGGHGSWPGNEVYGIDLETQQWFRQTDPSAMQRQADGTWINLDGSPISCHTYGGIAAVEATNEFFVFLGAPWPLGGFINDLWAFNVNTSRWRLIASNPLNTALKRTPHLLWREADQKLYVGRHRTWRWYDPVTDEWQSSFVAGGEVGTAMSIAADTGIYTFRFSGSDNHIDFVTWANVGVSQPSDILTNYPQFTAYADWSVIDNHWNSWLWDPVRQMAICWTGGAGSAGSPPDPGKRMFALDFVNGKLYEFLISGDWPIAETGTRLNGARSLGAFTRFTYIEEWDAYICSNGIHDVQGLMVMKPGTLTLRAE